MISIGVAYRDYISRLTDPEEPTTEEYDPDYTEEPEDDLPGATSHATSLNPISHAMNVEASALLLCNNLG